MNNMERPDKLAKGQLWSRFGQVGIVHRSPTGQKWRFLDLTNFVAFEIHGGDEPPSYFTYQGRLDGTELVGLVNE